MYLKHIDAYGNELGLYRSIREAANKLQSDVMLLSTLIRHKLPFTDGSVLLESKLSNADSRVKKASKVSAVKEYLTLGTHYRFLARKYNLTTQEVTRAIEKHRSEQALHSAYAEWLATGDSVEELAQRHGTSAWKLHNRINKQISA